MLVLIVLITENNGYDSYVRLFGDNKQSNLVRLRFPIEWSQTICLIPAVMFLVLALLDIDRLTTIAPVLCHLPLVL